MGACSQSPGGATTDSPTTPVTLDTVSIVTPITYDQVPAADGEAMKNLEKVLGVNLNVTWVPNASYNDKMTALLAGNDLPQLLVVQGKTPAFVQAAQAGAFWDLTDYINDYPNLKPQESASQLSGVPVNTAQIWQNSSVNGKIYGVFRLRDAMRVAVIIRADWLKNLGLSVPTTTDELYQVAKAFTENDPDGNGKNDTYGLIIPKWPGGYGSASPYDIMETWFGAPNNWGVQDGKLVPGFSTDAFFTADAWIKDMITKGYVNPDFATLDSGSWNDPFVQGKGGIIVDLSSRAGQLMSTFKTNDPTNYGQYVTMEGNLIGPGGTRLSYPTTGYNGFIAIPKSSVPDEAHLRAVLTVLDKMNSPEGQIAINNGIEGVNFQVQDSQFAVGLTDPASVQVITADALSMGQLGMQVNGYQAYTSLPAGQPELDLYNLRMSIHARDSAGTVVNDPTLPLVSSVATELGPTLNNIVPDARIKYFSGQLDDAGFKAEIQKWFDQGGQKIVDDMNQLYQAMPK